MSTTTKRNALLLIILVFVAVFFVRQLFIAMNLDLKTYSPFNPKPNSKTTKSDWYNWVEPLARALGAEYGIPWQAILVQTAQETGWGKSTLLRRYNNFAGVKYPNSGAPSKVNMKTGEVYNGNKVVENADFAAWPSPYEGMKGYVNFFHRNKRYATALKYPHDPHRFIEEIKKAGYATDPNYVSKLHGMLEKDLKVKRS